MARRGREAGGGEWDRRFFASSIFRLFWIVSSSAGVTAIRALYSATGLEDVFTGVVLIDAAIVLAAISWKSRRPLVEIMGLELIHRSMLPCRRERRVRLQDVAAAEATADKSKLILKTRSGETIDVPLSPLPRADREDLVGEILRRIPGT